MLSGILGIGDSALGMFILVVLSTLALVLFIIVGRGAGRGDRTAGTTGTIDGCTDMGVTDMGVTSGTSSMDGNNRDNEDTEGKECCCTLLFKCQFKCCNTLLGVLFGSTSID